jgi:DNA-directed RNA polymerase alpha subunit
MIEANASVERLDFTVGTYNSLRRLGITTVAELACRTEQELLNLIPRAMSPYKRVDEIKVKLQMHGRSLATLPPIKPSVAPHLPYASITV